MSTHWACGLNTTSALWQESCTHPRLTPARSTVYRKSSGQLPSRRKDVLAKRVVKPWTCKITVSSPWAERLHEQGAEGPLGNGAVRSGKRLTVGKGRWLGRSWEKITYRVSRVTYMVPASQRPSCCLLCVLPRGWQSFMVHSFWADLLSNCWWCIAFGRAAPKKSCGAYQEPWKSCAGIARQVLSPSAVCWIWPLVVKALLQKKPGQGEVQRGCACCSEQVN